ncbi:MAG: glutathione S-transferase family protein [Myxococcota bacterium]
MLTLYTTAKSANGRKPLAVLRHLGLNVEVREVDVYRGEGQRPEYLSIQPQGKVPALVDGNLILWESNAIVQYLAEAYGDYRLTSRDPARRADIARWLFWEAALWQPAWIPVLAPSVAEVLGLAPRPADEPAWDDPNLERQLVLAEAQLADQPHFVGGELTLADFGVAGMLTYAQAVGFPFQRYPNLSRFYEGMEALDAWQSTRVPPW